MSKQLIFPHQEYEQAVKFVGLVEGADFSRGKFESRYPKLKFIGAVLGYTVLKYKGKAVIPIGDASTPQLSATIENNYRTALRKIERYEGNVRNQDIYKKIAELLKFENGLNGEELEDVMETTSIYLNDASDIELTLLSKDFGKKVLGGFYLQR